MSGNSVDFNDGCVLSNEVNRGKSACVGRLAVKSKPCASEAVINKNNS